MEVKLRKWTIADKKLLMNICNNVDRKYLSNRLPLPYEEKDATWWLNMVFEEDEKTGIFRAIVVDGACLGNISVEVKKDVSCKDSEIGYLLLTSEWSKGVMTEAVKQICKIAFSKLEIERITGLVYEPNIASRRVLEKNNFTKEGILKKAIFKNNNFYDLYMYGKCRED